MKSFKEYLTESTKEHKLTLRFACDISEDDANRIESFLGKYDLQNISRVSTTPITKNPAFFSEEVTNAKVSKMDITTGYPISADILRQQMGDLLGCNIKYIAVHPEGWEPKEEISKEDEPERKALLDTEYDKTEDNGEHYGRDFVDNFLSSLTKREDHDKAEVENALSPKPVRDEPVANGAKLEDDKPSKSVISGEEK